MNELMSEILYITEYRTYCSITISLLGEKKGELKKKVPTATLDNNVGIESLLVMII